jgi:protein-disulfide isomerase
VIARPIVRVAAALALLAGPASAQQPPAKPPAKPDLARPGSSFSAEGKKGTWQTVIARTARGHLIGNPDAKGRLVAFVSYTCPPCADFTARGEQAIDLLLVTPGRMSLEVRPRIASGLDLTASLLARCGDPSGFKARHQTLMAAQGRWLAKARAAPASQQAIWERADKAARMNAAAALGLTAMLARRGQSIAQLDACVANDAAAEALRAGAAADAAEFALAATTPAFALDGKLLPGVHGWDALYPVLSARFAGPAD